MTTVRDLLAAKNYGVLTIARDQTVLEAVFRMNDHRVGALVLMECHRIAGIFRERAVLKRLVTQRRGAGELRVEEVMTKNVLTDPVTQRLQFRRTALNHHLQL